NGLPNVAQNLKRGEAISVVFLGGSVTEGGGQDGYVVRVARWLQAQYPQSKISVTNAGIGGTNSDYGARRMDRDVLAAKPDLLFVEYAVNDNGDHSASMERIVRKTWMRNPLTDIVFMYHLHREFLPVYQAGNLPPAAASHDQVAAFYGIPAIGTGLAAAEKINSGAMKWEDFSGDMVHPKPAGYAIYVDWITQSLQTLLRAGVPGPHTLAETFSPNLVVYDQRVIPVPPPAPAPFVSRDGKTAEAAYDMPTIGVHWVAAPTYQSPDGARWGLWYELSDKAMKLDKSVGTDRANWAGPLVYFVGGNDFTAALPKADPLASGGNRGNRLGAKGKGFAILTFTAPQPGRYVFSVKSHGVTLWSNNKTIGLNVIHFPTGQTSGQSLAFYSTTVDAKANVDLEVPIALAAGDQVAFAVDTNADGGGGGAYWENLQIRTGYYAQ
ncbi:MAG: GDSL-type esterase/lipase family protein, partial [Armatimonadota bacterium]|nr:GDSL-type esterase/lipase family protein [Armatimonadota bacterium]